MRENDNLCRSELQFGFRERVFTTQCTHVCNNPMSVCGRNWREFVCVSGVVTESVNEVYKEWYGSVDITEMDTVSVLNDMIDIRDGWGSCSILSTEDVNFIINDICTNFGWSLVITQETRGYGMFKYPLHLFDKMI